MTKHTATGTATVIAAGFVAYGEIDQTEGRGGRRELGEFTTIEEAIDAAKGQGIQGDPGEVSAFEWIHYEGGAVVRHTTPLIGRRRTPEGFYKVGWLDRREYAR